MDGDGMSGMERKRLQEELGTDVIVEELNWLRFQYGFDAIIIATPKVEIKLRSGEMALIPLKVVCKTQKFVLSISFPRNYPKDEPMDIELSLPSENDAVSTLSVGDINCIQTRLIEYSRKKIIPPKPTIFLSQGNSNSMEPQFVRVEALIKKLNDELAGLYEEYSEAPNLVAEIDLVEDIDTKEVESICESTNYGACMVCGNVLFQMGDIEQHEPTQKDIARRGQKIECSSYFIASSLSWMGDVSDTCGKLLCTKCGSKLGQWSWSGSQCSCGTWITPAFQITRTKVDIKSLYLS